MTPEQKVATLMVVVGEERAGLLLAGLPKDQARKVLGALARLDRVDAQAVDGVVREALVLIRQQKCEGTQGETARRIVAAAATFLSEDSLRTQMETGLAATSLAEALDAAPQALLVSWLERESPTVCASLLCLARPDRAAQLFRALSAEKQPRVCEAIAALESVSAEAIETLREEVESLVQAQRHVVKVGGAAAVAQLLQNVDSALQGAILAKMDERDGALSGQLRRQLLSVERLSQLSPRSLALLCARIEERDLVLILKLESQETRARYLASVSKNRAQNISEALEGLGKVPRRDVDAATERLVELVGKLKGEGILVLPWEEDLV